MKRTDRSDRRLHLHRPLLVLLALTGCAPATASKVSATPAGQPGSHTVAPVTAEPERPSAASTPSSSSVPDTAAGQQFSAWLAAFNTGSRPTLDAYHDQHFPRAVASGGVSSPEREYQLSRGTGGFEVRRIEASESTALVVLLKERNSPQYARVRLEVSAQPPHAVTSFRIGPIPTPRYLLSPTELQARTLRPEARRAALDAIGRELESHYVDVETAARMRAGLQRKQQSGAYDAITDSVEFADVVSRDLQRLGRDKHLGLRFGPMPPEPKADGPEPPWLARSGYGLGAVEHLSGNVALLSIRGFPPPFPSLRAALAEHLSEVADGDAAILDLRENNGGVPATVALVASYFFDADPVHLGDIYRRDTDSTIELWTERELPGRRFGSHKPLYILTGPRTFSGGEGLAYELQARGRAVVVGEGTGGGAHPTGPYAIAGGFVLNVPWGKSINPVTGTNWEGIGVVPDVAAPEADAIDAAHRLALERLGRQ